MAAQARRTRSPAVVLKLRQRCGSVTERTGRNTVHRYMPSPSDQGSLDSFNSSIRVTIPAVLGTRSVNKAIQDIVDWVPSSLRRTADKGDQSDKVQRLADDWPEYVLGPKNPLCFLAPDMPCSFFSVDDLVVYVTSPLLPRSGSFCAIQLISATGAFG